MIISQVIGGLGNQMFQYAAGRCLAAKLNTSLVLDIAGFENYKLHTGFALSQAFALPVGVASAQEVRTALGWRGLPFVQRVLKRMPDAWVSKGSFIQEPYFYYWAGFDELVDGTYLSGYWQSEKYFRSCEQQIRADFTFAVPIDLNAQLALDIAGCNSVSLHVRRGDYASNPQTTATHGLCSPAYYADALAHIRQRIPDARLYVFSDDIEWVRSNLSINLPHVFVQHNHGANSHHDMMLMSRCKHHIIANSSFSWWGAWLNPSREKIVIAPKKWFAAEKRTDDLFCLDWVTL